VRLLTVNAGSTSLKLEMYALDAPLPPIAQPPDPLARYATIQAGCADRPDAVAHRIVRVPDEWEAVTLLDDRARTQLGVVGGDAPLHDAPALRAAAAIAQSVPGIPQYAVADGAFHRTLSPAAYTYAIPRELTRRGLRRRGFHGLSHEYAAHRAAYEAQRDVVHARIVTLHLGGGSSLCAVRDGASIDTTMGFTPLEGIPMATRSGSVDPGLLLHLLQEGTTAGELAEMLERRSGLLGISGRSSDVRELLAASGDADAQLALEVLVWRTKAALGAMLAVLGGADLLAFTGGIGENAAGLRERILDGIAGDAGVHVIAARENWMLARAVILARTA